MRQRRTKSASTIPQSDQVPRYKNAYGSYIMLAIRVDTLNRLHRGAGRNNQRLLHISLG